MGQAKIRGSYEIRKAAAVERHRANRSVFLRRLEGRAGRRRAVFLSLVLAAVIGGCSLL